jgi:hypothetical protein
MVRGRCLSVATHKEYNKSKGRSELMNKRTYLELYDLGTIVDNYAYTKRKIDFIEKNYE